MRLQTILSNKKELRSALFGLILGDGYIRNYTPSTGKSEFRFTHSPEQEDYLEFKRCVLNYYPGVTTRKTHRDTFLKKTGKTYPQIELTSNMNKYAGFVRRKLYPKGTKKITAKILEQLSDFSLYLWYLDDGYLNIRYNEKTGKVKEYRVFLYLESNTLEECVDICKWFVSRYNISPNINKKGKGYSIYLNSSKTREFMKIIEPFYDLVPSMRRKYLRYHNLL